jgi:hypothetical protein
MIHSPSLIDYLVTFAASNLNEQGAHAMVALQKVQGVASFNIVPFDRNLKGRV